MATRGIGWCAMTALTVVVAGAWWLPDQILTAGVSYEVSDPAFATVALPADGGASGRECELRDGDVVAALGWSLAHGWLVREASLPAPGDRGACRIGDAVFAPFWTEGRPSPGTWFDGSASGGRPRRRRWIDLDARAKAAQDAREAERSRAEGLRAAARAIVGAAR